MTGCCEHGLDGVGVETAVPDFVPQLVGGGGVGGPGRTVRARLAHRLIDVGGGEDARWPRDGRAAKATRVAGAVETLLELRR
jgi:hypothetical protein